MTLYGVGAERTWPTDLVATKRVKAPFTGPGALADSGGLFRTCGRPNHVGGPLEATCLRTRLKVRGE